MRFTTLSLAACVIGFVAFTAQSIAQEIRVEAESGSLNGFSVVQNNQFSGGARINGDIANPSATYTFAGWDGPYDVLVAYCDEDDGISSYTLTGSSAGAIASWLGDQPTGTTTCGSAGLVVREVASSISLEQGETITFACERDPSEPCRVDYFDFIYVGPMPPVGERAFPGAMGFGAGAAGARGLGAEVCVVANLADAGPGSFRACAEQGPPAYITFAVSGYIDLNSGEVNISANKTVECATAPGDGVVFRKSRLHIAGDNVILRGCRAWAGNEEPGGEPLGVRDGIVVGDTPDTAVHNAIVANSSMMFATDENGGTYYPVENVTLQHNISAWALRSPPPNRRSYGMLISQGAGNVTAVENFFAFNRGRNPRVAWSSSPVEVVSNLVYCHAYNAVEVDNSTIMAHVIGNRFKGRWAAGNCNGIANRHIDLADGSIAYASENTTNTGSPAIIEVDGSSELATEPLFVSGITPVSSEEVEERVFAKAGPAQLISVEIDAFDDYVNGTGKIVDTVDDLGGWPTLQGGMNPPDSDGDGIPDWWETAHCGGPCAPTGDHDGDGYENIEEWFHSFYRPRAPASLDVDASALGSDGNGVFEPGELVEVAPSWRNDVMPAVSLDGIASDFSGPSGATYTVVAEDASYGTVEPGETASCGDTGICYQMELTNPAARPRVHWDATFDESLSEGSTQTWTLHIGESFSDVPRTNAFYGAVETVLHRGVIGGCGDGMYCPTRHIGRGAMPLFLLRAKEGRGYRPPACVAGEELFGDVPASAWNCKWIEELARRGVVSGCGDGNYCPGGKVSRAEIAVFLLKTLEGASYTPPPCDGIFTDVACPSKFADWVEELLNRGIVSGCSTEPLKYCPSSSVRRMVMARFVKRTFGLSLYGP